MRPFRLATSLLFLLPILLSGCATSFAPRATQGAQLSGTIHGGQQPVSGATVQFYAINTTVTGGPSTALLATPAITNAQGNFDVTGQFSCPSPSSLVYLVATGGSPSPSVTNPQIALMAALGLCGNLTNSTFVNINEVTTVAAVYALAPYMTDFTAIGSISSQAAAIAGAFTYASELADFSSGTSPGPIVPTGTTVPVAQINTIADIYASCINSPGGVAGDSSVCGQLFSFTLPNVGAAPTNTVASMLNLEKNPSLNVASLFNLILPSSPFQPMDTSAPPTLAVALQVTGILAGTLTPASATFPNTTVGTSSSIAFTLTNNGNVPFPISNIGAQTYFSNTNNCPATLAASTSCTINLTFAPTVAGPVSSTLYVSYTIGNTIYQLTSSVSATALPQNLIFSPASVAFPNATVGTVAATQTVTLTNVGAASAAILGVSITGTNAAQFSQSNNCPANLAPSASCTFTLNATPTQVGPVTATLAVSTTLVGPTLPLAAAGAPAAGANTLVFSDTQFYVPAGGSGVVTVTNTGSGPVNFSLATISSGFTQTNTCGTSLAAGATCNVQFTAAAVAYDGSPQAQVPFTGTFTLYSDAATPVQSVALFTANALNVFDFGTASVGYPSAPLFTASCQVACFGSPTITGPNSSDFPSAGSSGCGSRGTCNYYYQFVPTASGYRIGTFTYQNNATAKFLFVGRGTPATGQVISYSISASSLNFGTYYAGGASPQPMTLTLTNTGNQPVAFSSISVTGNNVFFYTFSETDTCAPTLAVGATCTITVSVSARAGQFGATLVIRSNSLTATVNVPLSVNVLTPTFGPVFSSTTVTLAQTQAGTPSTPQTVTLSNTGNIPMDVAIHGYSGSGASNFTYTSNCTTVPVGGNCTITLNGTPPGVGTTSAALAVVVSNQTFGFTFPQNIAVSVTGF